MSHLRKFAAVIPAAGNSLRMGEPKTHLKFPDGTTFATHLIKSFSEAGADPVVLIINNNTKHPSAELGNAVIVENRFTELGRSYSIKLGLQMIKRNLPCFIQNVDNPYFNVELIHHLLENARNDSYLVPVYNGKGGHPVLLGQEIVSAILVKDPYPDFIEVLQNFRRIDIAWNDPGILVNINYPSDYENYLSGR